MHTLMYAWYVPSRIVLHHIDITYLYVAFECATVLIFRLRRQKLIKF